MNRKLALCVTIRLENVSSARLDFSWMILLEAALRVKKAAMSARVILSALNAT